MSNTCISCSQSISQQKADDEKTIQLAKQRAKEKQQPVGLYRDEEGTLFLTFAIEQFPNIIMLITPDMQ